MGSIIQIFILHGLLAVPVTAETTATETASCMALVTSTFQNSEDVQKAKKISLEIVNILKFSGQPDQVAIVRRLRKIPDANLKELKRLVKKGIPVELYLDARKAILDLIQAMRPIETDEGNMLIFLSLQTLYEVTRDPELDPVNLLGISD